MEELNDHFFKGPKEINKNVKPLHYFIYGVFPINNLRTTSATKNAARKKQKQKSKKC